MCKSRLTFGPLVMKIMVFRSFFPMGNIRYFAENTKNFIYELFHMDNYANYHTGSDNNFRSRKFYSFLW